jgi:hypothetical protein
MKQYARISTSVAVAARKICVQAGITIDGSVKTGRRPDVQNVNNAATEPT